jgi:hypothetical protein
MYSKNDLDVDKIRMVYSDSDIYKEDSVLVCNSLDSDINLNLHTATGSRNTYLVKNAGWSIVYINLRPEDTMDLESGWSYFELFPYESVLITDYAVSSWVMLDFHLLWDFRKMFDF